VRAWLAYYGAPLYGETLARSTPAPAPELVLAEGLAFSRRDPFVARALPVALWRQSAHLDLDLLRHEVSKRGQDRAFGFFLELTGKLSQDPRIEAAAQASRPRSPLPLAPFFEKAQGPLEAMLAERNTPPLARAWGFTMNMGLDSFETMFRKAR
jgi:hypothetical protein